MANKKLSDYIEEIDVKSSIVGTEKIIVGEEAVTINQIKAFVSSDEYEAFVNLAAFPATGVVDKIYLAKDTGKFYTWETSVYTERSGPGTNATTLNGHADTYFATAASVTALSEKSSYNIQSLTGNFVIPNLTTQEKAIQGFEKIYVLTPNGHEITLPSGNNTLGFEPSTTDVNIICIYTVGGFVFIKGETAPAPDVTPPTLAMSVSTGTPNVIDIVASENVNITSSGFTFTASGGAVTVSSVTGSGTSTPKLNLSRSISAGETITWAYNSATGNTTDIEGNELVSISGVTVTNNISSFIAQDQFTAANTTDIAGRTTPIGGFAWSRVDGTGTFGIVSNKLKLTSNGASTDAIYVFDPAIRNRKLKVTIGATFTNPGQSGIFVAFQDTNNYILITTACSLVIRATGSSGTVFTGSTNWVIGDVIEVTLGANSIILVRNGVELTSYTGGSTISASKVGFQLYQEPTTSFDDITIE